MTVDSNRQLLRLAERQRNPAMTASVPTEDKRHENRLRLVEDHIGKALAESASNGELRDAPSYGKPIHFGDGYAETPDELRMGYKILKDAGVVPPEVELMHAIEALRQRIDGAAPHATSKADVLRLSELRQQLAIRMERLRG